VGDVYEYFDHGADIGIIGKGPNVETAFESAALAMFGLTLPGRAPVPTDSVEIEFDEPDPEFALLCCLNGLLAESRVRELALSEFQVTRKGDHWVCRAKGSRWTHEMEPGVEVKGATFTMLKVRQIDDQWEARCVVDV
jgi:SHS2 domain-containing protein